MKPLIHSSHLVKNSTFRTFFLHRCTVSRELTFVHSPFCFLTGSPLCVRGQLLCTVLCTLCALRPVLAKDPL
jgi:hypothetical protein